MPLGHRRHIANAFLLEKTMKIKNPFLDLTKFEKILLAVSLVVVTASFLLSPKKDYLTLVSSLIGVTALIFVAKGYVLGEILCIIFAFFYGIVSFYFKYYGEVITYLCMTAPMSIMATIEWIKNPYGETKEVKVKKINKKEIITMLILTVIVTTVFYFILKALNTASLVVSTFSITTSFLAVYLTYLRSSFYALAYGLNDVVLIVLWVIASIKDISYLPMVICFIMFLINDIYGFYNWERMRKRQSEK